MDPNKWGPHAWYFIESVFLNIPESQTDMTPYVDFLVSLQHVLPCRLCRENYKDHIQKRPIPQDKVQLVQWVLDLHNDIRVAQGKPTRTTKEVVSFYSSPKQTTSYMWLVTLLLLVPILYFGIRKYAERIR